MPVQIERRKNARDWTWKGCRKLNFPIDYSWTGTVNYLQLPPLLDFNQPRACRIKFFTGRFSSLVKYLSLPSSPSLLYRANMAVGPLADITRGLCNTPHLQVFTGQEEGPANLHIYLQQKYLTQSSYIPRVQQCLSPRRNWGPPGPIPSPASECVPPSPWNQRGGGGHTRLGVVGPVVQFGRLEKKPSTLSNRVQWL
jgi:hypothetical protein